MFGGGEKDGKQDVDSCKEDAGKVEQQPLPGGFLELGVLLAVKPGNNQIRLPKDEEVEEGAEHQHGEDGVAHEKFQLGEVL